MKKAISLILALSFLLALTMPAAAADSAVGTTLLEIDFVKEESTNADVPAIVVETVRNDETL